MGWNTTVVVLNDALSDIAHDPQFGAKLSDAIGRNHVLSRPLDVSAGCFVNAATVVEQHHADGIIVVAVGGNCGRVLSFGGDWTADDVTVLRNVAERHGYRLTKKRERPRKGKA